MVKFIYPRGNSPRYVHTVDNPVDAPSLYTMILPFADWKKTCPIGGFTPPVLKLPPTIEVPRMPTGSPVMSPLTELESEMKSIVMSGA